MFKRLCILVVSAIVITAVVGVVVFQKESAYLEKNPFFFDAASYQYYNIVLAQQLTDTNRLALAWDEWLHNARHPIQTVPLILLAPQLLDWQYSFMPMALTSLAIFLALFMWTIYRRQGSALAAVCISALVATVPIIYHPTYGLATFWLEWFPALCIGCAVLCLLNACRFGKYEQYWVMGFGVCTALGVLGRYVAAVIVLAIPFPVVLYYIIGSWRQHKTWQPWLRSIGLAVCLFLVLAGYFLIAHFQSNYLFYITYNVPLKNDDLAASYHFITQTWLSFWTHDSQYWLGRYLIIVVTALWLLAQTITVIIHKHWRWAEAAVAIWLVIGGPALLVATKILNATHPVLLSTMTPLIAVATPFSYQWVTDWWRRCWVGLSVGWVLTAIVVILMQHRQITSYVESPVSLPRELSSDLTAALSAVGSNDLVWNLYVDEYTNLPTLSAYYSIGILYLPAGQPYFYADRYAWEADYPGRTPADIAELVYQASNHWVDVAIVFADPDQARLNGWMNNDYSRAVADYMARQLPTNPQWQLTGTIESNYFGKLLVYRNAKVEASNYQQAFNDPLSIHPNPEFSAGLTEN